MKRYGLFAFADYYPDGGWSDFVKAFDTQEEAKMHAEDGVTVARDKYHHPRGSNFQVVDMELSTILFGRFASDPAHMSQIRGEYVKIKWSEE